MGSYVPLILFGWAKVRRYQLDFLGRGRPQGLFMPLSASDRFGTASKRLCVKQIRSHSADTSTAAPRNSSSRPGQDRVRRPFLLQGQSRCRQRNAPRRRRHLRAGRQRPPRNRQARRRLYPILGMQRSPHVRPERLIKMTALAHRFADTDASHQTISNRFTSAHEKNASHLWFSRSGQFVDSNCSVRVSSKVNAPVVCVQEHCFHLRTF